LQKILQTTALILPDVLTARDSAMRKLNIIKSGPLLGGQEERLLNMSCSTQMDIRENERDDEADERISDTCNDKRNVPNQYVTTGRRQWLAAREEVVLSFINFLNVRLNIEDDKTISQMTVLLKANTITDVIDAGCPLVESLFGEDYSLLTNGHPASIISVMVFAQFFNIPTAADYSLLTVTKLLPHRSASR